MSACFGKYCLASLAKTFKPNIQMMDSLGNEVKQVVAAFEELESPGEVW